MAIVTVSSKGQFVIPVSIRKALGIGPKSRVRITLSGDGKRAVLEPIPANPIEALTGIFKGYPGSLAKELLDERKSREHKEG